MLPFRCHETIDNKLASKLCPKTCFVSCESPTKIPTESPIFEPTSAHCRNNLDFVTFKNRVTITCASITTEKMRKDYCNVPSRFEGVGPYRPIKEYCPVSCNYDCSSVLRVSVSPTKASTLSPTIKPIRSPSRTPTELPTRGPVESPTKTLTESRGVFEHNFRCNNNEDFRTKKHGVIITCDSITTEALRNRYCNILRRFQGLGPYRHIKEYCPVSCNYDCSSALMRSVSPTKASTSNPTIEPTTSPTKTPTDLPTRTPVESQTKIPIESPIFERTAARCHDNLDFVTQKNRVTITCDTITTEALRNKYCNVRRRFRGVGPYRLIKEYCPLSCHYACPPALSQSEMAVPPTQILTAFPIKMATKLCNQKSLKERKDRIFDALVTVSGGSRLNDSSSDQYKAYHWLVDSDCSAHCLPDWRLIQRYVMALFYFSTNGDEWYNSSLFLTCLHECEWYPKKLICTNERYVLKIKLDKNNLGGTLPFELQALVHLDQIDLDINSISGTVPNTIGNLSNLIIIDLEQNQLSGTIPSSIYGLPNLRALHLNDNMLVGTISNQISKLANIMLVQLHNNMLEGTLPAGIGNLNRLITLQVDGNDEMFGTMHQSICSLKENKQLSTLMASCNVKCGCCDYISGCNK